MKKILIFTFSALFLNTYAQTNVSGFINQNTTWNLAGSPYIVIGNALLSNGFKLTIEPGVIVKFDDSTALQIDGELIAIGDAQNRITFTSSKAVSAPGDWAKIHFADACADAVFDNTHNYLTGSIMKYCDVLYGGGIGFGEIQVEKASPFFSNCTFSNSKSEGIYSNQAAFIIDSSSVKNCMGYGLSFHSDYQTPCDLIVSNDTISNNRLGGIYFGYVSGCSHTIKNNFVSGNSFQGAIHAEGTIDNLLLTENYFVNDSVTYSNDNTPCAIVTLSGEDHIITKNYFIDNFVDNDYLLAENAILFDRTFSGITFECNKFINNMIVQNSHGVLYLHTDNDEPQIVKHNLFDGNADSSAYGIIVNLTGNSGIREVYFTNNMVINNSSKVTATCCRMCPYLNTNVPLFFISSNEFSNNTAGSVISFEGGTNQGNSFNCVSMKKNNIYNPSAQYEIYNNIPYGSPDVHLDSNYWGTTSAQHIDSMIYDYFDFANQSIVYYLPVLTFPTEVDTTCPTLGIGISEWEINSASIVFPNPFSHLTAIHVEKTLVDATLQIFNIYGQCARTVDNISGREIIVNRDNMAPGVYFFLIAGMQEVRYTGKLVVQ